ncbi:MAG: 6-pyruvoyl tetrahydropterin synthase family protein [Candidatus Dormibacteria bacterium]
MTAVFTLRKQFTFEAAHFLPRHHGKCRRMHGHSWVGWVEMEGDSLQAQGPETGMLVDYGELAAALAPLLENHLDHYCLNESLELESPTSEAVARWIWHRLSEGGTRVSAVTIRETCTSECVYRPGPDVAPEIH